MRPLVCFFRFMLLTDVCRYEFDLSMSSDGSNDSVAAFRQDVRWLCSVCML